MNCKFCDTPLPTGSNPRRLFCNDAHKQAYWRQKQQDDQHEALLAELEQLRQMVKEQAQGHTYTSMLSELVELRQKVHDQAHTIELQQQEFAELEQEIDQLKKRLDFERRYLEDTKAYTFKAWLKKQTSPLRDILINDQSVPPKTSRAGYQAHVQRLAPDQMEEFTRLWKLMLLSRP